MEPVERHKLEPVEGKRNVIVGIDLGTCTSLLSYVDANADFKVVHHSPESIVTPSVVHFPKQFQADVGLDAKRMAAIEPDNCAQFMKLSMGDVRRARRFHTSKYTPEMLSALVLRRLVEQAIDELGGEDEVAIRDVVVTVPSSWDDLRRDATRLAARMAGLRPISILSEPVAVALEVALTELQGGKTVLVYDFGGGTFDVTIFRHENRTIRVLANLGLPTLGGKNLDERLMDYVLGLFRDEFGSEAGDPIARSEAKWQLLDRCEAVKVALSRKAPAQTITVTSGDKTGKYSISREDLDVVLEPDIDRTMQFVSAALLRAGLKPRKIDLVLPVGGSSQIPTVTRRLADLFGEDKLGGRVVNPQETVARGACRNAADIWVEAVRAGTVPESAVPAAMASKLGDTTVLREETALPLSMITLNGDGEQRVSVLVPQGSQWPAVGGLNCVTATDHQSTVVCKLRFGEETDAEATTRLATVSFSLEPGTPAGCPLRIEIWYDGPNRLWAAMWDGRSNTVQKQEVTWPGPTDKQVQGWTETLRETTVVID